MTEAELVERVRILEETIQWYATSGHSAYHKSADADFRNCNKPLCAHARKVLDGKP